MNQMKSWSRDIYFISRHQTECDSSSSSGFDQQISDGKALATAASKRLPAINATIQQAVSSNAETSSVLGDVSEDYSSALGTISALENLVNSFQVTKTVSLAPSKHLAVL